MSQNVTPIQKARFERERKKCPNVEVVVRVDDTQGLPEYLHSLEWVVLRLGPGLKPSVPVQVDDHGWHATIAFQGRFYPVSCPWKALCSVQAFYPPPPAPIPTPATPAQLRRAA